MQKGKNLQQLNAKKQKSKEALFVCRGDKTLISLDYGIKGFENTTLAKVQEGFGTRNYRYTCYN